jgi:hypothetical protein
MWAGMALPRMWDWRLTAVGHIATRPRLLIAEIEQYYSNAFTKPAW